MNPIVWNDPSSRRSLSRSPRLAIVWAKGTPSESVPIPAKNPNCNPHSGENGPDRMSRPFRDLRGAICVTCCSPIVTPSAITRASAAGLFVRSRLRNDGTTRVAIRCRSRLGEQLHFYHRSAAGCAARPRTPLRSFLLPLGEVGLRARRSTSDAQETDDPVVVARILQRCTRPRLSLRLAAFRERPMGQPGRGHPEPRSPGDPTLPGTEQRGLPRVLVSAALVEGPRTRCPSGPR